MGQSAALARAARTPGVPGAAPYHGFMTAPPDGQPGPPLRDLLMRSLCMALLEEGFEKPPADWNQLAEIASHYTGRPVPPVKPSDFDFIRGLTVEQFATAITRGKAARYEEELTSDEQPAAPPPGDGTEQGHPDRPRARPSARRERAGQRPPTSRGPAH